MTDNKIPTPQEVQQKITKAREDFQKAFKGFHDLLKEKTLKENRSIGQNNVEKETVDKVVKSCVVLDHMNVGEGVLAMSTIALREHLAVRDRVNELEYKLETFAKELKRLKKALGEDK